MARKEGSLLVGLLLLMCVSFSCGQPHGAGWDPTTDLELGLGPNATLTTLNDTIRVFVDNELNVTVIKDLKGFTCYIIEPTIVDVDADDIIQELSERGMEVIKTDFRRASQVYRDEVESLFGSRVTHFCLQNPIFLLAKAGDESPTLAATSAS